MATQHPPLTRGITPKQEDAMKIHKNPNNSGQDSGRQDDKGFTLIEILIAIVLVGILSAVAVVGISNLVSKGSDSGCGASKDAANAAAAGYFAGNSNTYPTTFAQLTTASLTMPSTVTYNAAVVGVIPIGQQATVGTWKLTMTAGAVGVAPTFVCS
jgi:prepilin-type N-terminal cleavage/methylation domain-containing protein